MKWLGRYIGGRITHEASAIARYLAKRFPHWWETEDGCHKSFFRLKYLWVLVLNFLVIKKGNSCVMVAASD
jgi:glutathione S-transferase